MSGDLASESFGFHGDKVNYPQESIGHVNNWNQDQPAVRYLKKWLPVYFPVIPRNHAAGKGVGGYVPRKTSSGSFSFHSEGRAADIYLNAFDAEMLNVGDALFKMFMAHNMAFGVDHIIWNHQIWSTAHGGPRPYTGGNGPHTNHIHVAFTRSGSQKQSALLLALLPYVYLQAYGP